MKNTELASRLYNVIKRNFCSVPIEGMSCEGGAFKKCEKCFIGEMRKICVQKMGGAEKCRTR